MLNTSQMNSCRNKAYLLPYLDIAHPSFKAQQSKCYGHGIHTSKPRWLSKNDELWGWSTHPRIACYAPSQVKRFIKLIRPLTYHPTVFNFFWKNPSKYQFLSLVFILRRQVQLEMRAITVDKYVKVCQRKPHIITTSIILTKACGREWMNLQYPCNRTQLQTLTSTR